MEDVMLALIWLGLFAAAFFSWFYYLQARTKERTLLIEKGADASNFYGKKPERRGFRFPWLKWGIVITGTAAGFILSLFLASVFKKSLGLVMEPLLFGFIMFFGGISMIVAYYVDPKKENQA